MGNVLTNQELDALEAKMLKNASLAHPILAVAAKDLADLFATARRANSDAMQRMTDKAVQVELALKEILEAYTTLWMSDHKSVDAKRKFVEGKEKLINLLK